jgi:uncharacterized caspase-like protein
MRLRFAAAIVASGIFLSLLFVYSITGSPSQQSQTRQSQRGVEPEKQPNADAATHPGPYFALVIGIDDYQNLEKLKTAAGDAKAVAEVLHEVYGFQTQLLLNGAATRDEILKELYEYRKTLDKDANLLIYYAGHGYNDREAGKTYWLPVDAGREDNSRWIQSDNITADLKAIQARHILVISDSCYSGSMREVNPQTSRVLRKQMEGQSRTLLSSGRNEPVSDEGSGNHSAFAGPLINALENATVSWFSAQALYEEVQGTVAGNSEQMPSYGRLSNSGDDGYAEFIFSRRGPASDIPTHEAAVGDQPPVVARESEGLPRPEYRQVSFGKGPVTGARFALDGQTLIYSAAWDHPPVKLYSSRTDGSNVRALSLPPSDLRSVSRSGELAITMVKPEGRLARVSLDGDSPRDLLDVVGSADWSPDSTQLAVAHYENGKWRLEYPIGNVLYEANGLINDVRLSPQGDAIAFMDHPTPSDDRGTVSIIDLKGVRRALTREWIGEEGLAWSPDGREIWFTATSADEWGRELYAVSRTGKQRWVMQIPGSLVLEDIAADGRVLLMRRERRYEVLVGQIGGETHLLSWLEIMLGEALSRNGKYALLGDWSGHTGSDYGVYLANLDGSPAVLLGNGAAGDISPDNQWVTSILPSDPTKVLLLPTGIGQTRTVTAPHFHYFSANWTTDGTRLIVQASESDHPSRWWVQDLSGGLPRPITPPGIGYASLTVNHSNYVIGYDAVSKHQLYPIDGSGPKPVAGLSDTDEVVGGSLNADVLYVTPDPSAIPFQVIKVNISTGLRQPFLTVAPADPVGIVGIYNPIIAADEQKYIWTQVRVLSVLYVATGVK